MAIADRIAAAQSDITEYQSVLEQRDSLTQQVADLQNQIDTEIA